ncbi:substrate-binding domain-containing protein [Sansalvadorimonas sp. 2012CJ34-2]|uniref:Substrate-binding domain-containing protein n=1 Tax=Parendozoicomonas callyspongiae TaxID=2942213 RepID=A0ABT0PIB6_9GAMM|nr:substrate-binding domain-containing protein [Sansalvadorimonas sp. 2012CJ34-2]MCL6270991.1 substrate-binding domain-containing protein [Sansalvadorimonas sp. 2012CJ34-2]
MKKLLSLCLMSFALVTGCSSETETTTKTLAVVMPNATHGFLGESIKHAEAATKEFAEAKGYNYKFLTSAEASEQNNQLDTLINEKVDAIVLWPHNGDELRSGAQSVLNENIPLIVYDRLITGMEPTAEVLGDNIKIGEMAGKYLNKYFADTKDPVNILEFKGDNSTVPQQRSDGFYSTAKKKIHVVQQFDTGWQRATAQDQMENFINSRDADTVSSIKAVFTHDAEVAAGVLMAIKSYDGPKKLNIKLVTSVSLPKELLENFEPYQSDTGIDQVGYSFSPAMVRDAIQKGIDVLDGKEVSGQYLIETEEVDNSNVNAYRDGNTFKIRYSL